MDATEQLILKDPAYGLTERLQGVSFGDAKERITAALKDQGFGILTEIDVQATLKKKLGAEFRPYVILGACNPQLAHRALLDEIGIGLLLPCNVCVWHEGDTSVISIADPAAMFEVVANPRLTPIVAEASRRLKAALESARSASEAALPREGTT